MRALHFALVAGLLAGCSFGPTYGDINARTGRGAVVEVFAVGSHRVEGELLGWSDEGLLLVVPPRGNGRIVLVPTAAIQEVRIEGLGDFGGDIARSGNGRIRYGARYPQGVDEVLLRRLLVVYEQTDPDRFPQ